MKFIIETNPSNPKAWRVGWVPENAEELDRGQPDPLETAAFLCSLGADMIKSNLSKGREETENRIVTLPPGTTLAP